MKIGLQVPYFTWPSGPEKLGEQFGALAKRAEDAAFASFWVMDHFFQLPGLGAPDQDMLEGYSALSFAAARTSTIKLGTMVTGITYRQPGVLVKTATTLDVLSGGRAYFGVGAAWFEQEHLGLGVPFPPLKERFERLEETLRIAHQMWSGERGPFEGKYYQLAEAICVPMPLSKPHPPILIGGTGERKTLRLVAKYADATNISMGFNDDGVVIAKHKLSVLKEHCERERRSYDAIEKTVLATLWLSNQPQSKGAWVTADQALATLAQFREAGVDQLIFNMPNVERPETIEAVAEQIIRPAAKL
ncbi:MAG: LLM class F420-dependent oxidoreductase [Chloroflexota bacterium]|nr:LLM class F420-dependent oxidoreductase [Chloroflexota bacterium]